MHTYICELDEVYRLRIMNSLYQVSRIPDELNQSGPASYSLLIKADITMYTFNLIVFIV
jgi:hypothetical protein